jgi:multiple sugar transport system permease protein
MTLVPGAVVAAEETEAPPRRSAPRAVRDPRRARRIRIRYALVVLAFLLPSAIPMLMFVLGPMLAAAWISFNEWNLLAPMKWVGLDNYASLLSDPRTGEVFTPSTTSSATCPSSTSAGLPSPLR